MKREDTNSLAQEIASIFESIRENTYKGGNRFLLTGHLEIGALLNREFNSYILNEKSKQRMKTLTEKIDKVVKINFSKRTLYHALKFYQAYHGKKLDFRLSWSHYRILSVISNVETRKKLEKEAGDKGWSRDLLERYARESGYYGGSKSLKWNRPNGENYHYKIVKNEISSQKKLWIDLGFRCYRELDAKSFKEGEIVQLTFTKKTWRIQKVSLDSFLCHYLGILERVVDGDTFVAQIDLGFGLTARQKIRLLGINAPELNAPGGQESFESLKKKLKPGTNLLIRTHTQDKYGRYLGDVLYLSKKSSYETLREKGIHLNEELLVEY
ncbi:DUF1016 N-terminal domain-containing protein [Leptospira interrogans]|uniref:DUF1016 N-terminal domain-containing protein n=1 Tax=Leptospira interrogans TaxID=173 RepID=UPI0010C0DDB1|nr:DUF1016 N-terminal domain-containing protein [Leptospira interrogans]KAA1269116.1 nuclease [Leptospira interrogans serovar Weerasinghe]QCO42232.1 DUF1016 family protein [Leptospira interrogans]ULG80947.1 DUF1016 N-terminal domain-containing protein [Leptospira interrogans]UML68571.1 DUF1016 N-terminal domain-containing protein [Leptospira interrogans]UML71892.1 DUF1016 N-terminal domain-containing protein [Leptospira interrogans]